MELLSDRTASSVAFGILLCKPHQPAELVAPVLKAQVVSSARAACRGESAVSIDAFLAESVPCGI